MKFSLLLPTRKRPRQLELLIDNIVDTVFNMKDIEIQLAIDTDDPKTLDRIIMIKDKYPHLSLFCHVRGRGNSLVKHYYNWLTIFCTGEYLMVLNDDILFRTQDWDKLIYERLQQFIQDKPDKLVLGVVGDQDKHKLHHDDYIITGFPIVSKAGVDVLGFIFDPIFMADTSDDDICKLYATIGRVVDLRDICKIEHNPSEFKGLDNNYLSTHRKNVYGDDTYEEFIVPPYLPQTVAEMRFFLDKRILPLINHILQNK